MDMPSRNLIRYWLAYKSRSEIVQFLTGIEQEHGHDNVQDVKDMLNHERERARQGFDLITPAEQSLLSFHEQKKAAIAADLESRQKLYGNPSESN